MPPTAFSVPNRNILYLRETKLWRCGRGGRGGGRGGRGRGGRGGGRGGRGRGGGETCHMLTHAATLAGVGKKV